MGLSTNVLQQQYQHHYNLSSTGTIGRRGGGGGGAGVVRGNISISGNNCVEGCQCKSEQLFAPIKSKMKVLKKIKKRIGLAPRSSKSCPGPNNLPPLHFHHVHGDNIRISRDGTLARRYESFCKGITFSARPVKINERVCVKFSQISNNWSGVIRFGFTYNDPATLVNCLPKYACPDLTNKAGYWAKALNERYCERDNILFYYVTASGDVYFGINGEEKGVFISGVETRGPLWTLIDVYGNCSAVEFIDSRIYMYNRNIHNQSSRCTESIIDPSPPAPPQPTTTSSSTSSSSSSAATADLQRTILPAMQHMSIHEETPATIIPMSLYHHHHPTQSTSTVLTSVSTSSSSSGSSIHLCNVNTLSNNNINSNSNNSSNCNNGVSAGLIPLPFHPIKGRSVVLSSDRLLATRNETEFCQGYVFTARPIRIGEKIIVKILSTDHMYVGALALGLTSCNPAALQSSDLPDDSDLLLDRPEYWVVSKDIASTPVRGDEIVFCVTANGEVQISKNGGQPSIVMHVDQTLELWAFLDIYGSTKSVQIFSNYILPITRHHHQQQQQHNGHHNHQHLLQQSHNLHVLLPASESMNNINTQIAHQQQLTENQRLLFLQQQQQHLPLVNSPTVSSTAISSSQQSIQSTSSSPTNRIINVPATSTDMIQIQPGGTVLVVNLPPTQQQNSNSCSNISNISGGNGSNNPSNHNNIDITGNNHYPHTSRISQQQPITNGSTVSNGLLSNYNTYIEPVSMLQKTSGVTASLQSCNATTLSAWQQDGNAYQNHGATGAECTICYENSIDSVLYMCGHMCMCYDCAIQQWRGIGGGHCPLCRAIIRDVIRTYKS